MASQAVQPFFAEIMIVTDRLIMYKQRDTLTDRQTDRPRYSICINMLPPASAAMWLNNKYYKTKLEQEMWAIAQCDGRRAEDRWRPLFNATKFS